MICPICRCRLMPVGSTMVENMDTVHGPVTTVREAYHCGNSGCLSLTEGYLWTFNGESFIMHHLERHLEAA